MASSTSSLLLAPPHFSCQIAGRPTPSATKIPPVLSVPAVVRIRSWRRFAAARCEVALVPTRRLRALPRRRNALREKASPLLVEHQVRPPNHGALESHHQLNKNRALVGGTGEFRTRSSLDRHEPNSSCLDDQALSDLADKLEISGCLDAVRSGNVVSESNLDGEKDEGGDTEENHFCGTGARTGPLFSIYEDPHVNVVHVEVDEDDIISRSANAEGEASDDLQPVLSHPRVMAKEFESGKCEVPNNSSLFQFVAVQKNKSCVVDAEVSVNEPDLRAFAWSGFAALCGVCIVFAAWKLIWTNIKACLSRNLFDILRPGMKAGELDKGNIKVISNVHKFPGDLLGRPQLERHELMKNIKRAKESRERFSLRNVFSCNTFSNDDDENIAKIRRMLADVHTLEEGILEQSNTGKRNYVVFPCPVVAIKEEISANNGRQSVYLDDVSESDSSELSDISLSNDIIKKSVEQSVDLKNGAPMIDISVKKQYNVGEIELPEPTCNDERITDAKDRTSVVHAAEKKAHIYDEDDRIVGSNSIDTPSSDFERKEQFTDIDVRNLDCIQGIKPSVPFSSDEQMIYTKDNAHHISNDVVTETVDDFSPNGINISSSDLKNNKAPLVSCKNDLNYMQETEAPKTFANDAQSAHCKEFAHGVNIIGKEACKNPLMAISPQGIREESMDLMRHMQSMQEPEPSNRDDKQIIYANGKDHEIDIVHNETETSLETDNTWTLDKVSTSSLHALQEEIVQDKGAKISISEKREKITSSNKKARAYLRKNKGKLQKEMCSDKGPKTKLAAEGIPGTSSVVGPSNCVQKTKRVAHKQLKEVQSNQGVKERVAAQDVAQNSSMVDQKNSSQSAKRTRRKNQKNACHTQGAQTKEENPETALMANTPDDALRTENMKPLGGAGSSAEMLPPKDIFTEAQSNGFTVRMVREEELKLNVQTFEGVEAAVVETKTNMHGDNVMHERSDFKKSNTKMGVTAAKKSTKRQSLLNHSKSSNSGSNKDSEEPTDD